MRHNREAVSVGELVKVNMGMGCLKKRGFYETAQRMGFTKGRFLRHILAPGADFCHCATRTKQLVRGDEGRHRRLVCPLIAPTDLDG